MLGNSSAQIVLKSMVMAIVPAMHSKQQLTIEHPKPRSLLLVVDARTVLCCTVTQVQSI